MGLTTSKRTQRRVRRQIEAITPLSSDELHTLAHRLLGLWMPRSRGAGHSSPFDYLVHTFFEDGGCLAGFGVLRGEVGSAKPQAAGGRAAGDCVVWANRGGGKTMLGAAATLLDMLFKPGVQVRILGGSLEQSSRMYRYLRELIDRPMLRPMLAGAPTQRRLRLINGSEVEVLSQSQRSVRGVRVHKLRCDEVEEFDEEVWAAAQLVTRSGMCGPVAVRGSVEALSTMHRPFGLMHELTRGGGPSRTIFRWSVLEVLERCPPQRDCDTCPLWDDCRGSAKEASGFVRIDDAIAQRQRCSDDAWASEMLCLRPRRSDCVYANFKPGEHVRDLSTAGLDPHDADAVIVGGMDFGLRCPLVMLWARVVEIDERRVLWVFDEYTREDGLLEGHLDRIAARGWPTPQWIGADPAGRQRSSQTGLSEIDVMKSRGLRVRAMPSRLADGIELVRRMLDRDQLRIAPRCRGLIAAMQSYHFDPKRPTDPTPVKDGPDHLCDALRYMAMGLERGSGKVRTRRWAG